jgi:hypothetical protein
LGRLRRATLDRGDLEADEVARRGLGALHRKPGGLALPEVTQALLDVGIGNLGDLALNRESASAGKLHVGADLDMELELQRFLSNLNGRGRRLARSPARRHQLSDQFLERSDGSRRPLRRRTASGALP